MNDPDRRRLWETGSWRLLSAKPGWCSRMEFSADGRILACVGAEPAIVHLLDGETLDELATLTPAESYTTTDLAFSPDGALLAQITNRAGVVHLWDLRRIRAQLATMGLDWNTPPYAPPEAKSPPLLVTIHADAENQ